MRRWILLAGLLGSFWTLGMAFAAVERPVFDPTISLGVLLHLVTLIGSIVTALFFAGRFVERQKREFLEKIQSLHLDMTGKIGSLAERLSVMESRVLDLWESWKGNRG